MVLPREIAYLGAISAPPRRCEGDVVRSGSEMIHNKQKKHRRFYREISRYKTVVQVPLGNVPITVSSTCINVHMSIRVPTRTALSQTSTSTCARVSRPGGLGPSRLTPVDALNHHCRLHVPRLTRADDVQTIGRGMLARPRVASGDVSH